MLQTKKSHKIGFWENSDQAKIRVTIIAFACNTKLFAIAILFFLFFITSTIFGQTAKRFLANVIRLNTTEACDGNLTHSLDTLKNIPVKIFTEVIIRDACNT